MSSYHIDKCLCCTSSDLTSILDLGLQPPANSYRLQKNNKVNAFPLELKLCDNCWHSQLSYCVDRKILFEDYTYLSGTTITLHNFFKWFSNCLVKVLPPNARVLEIAANDGSLIKQMKAVGLKCIGVDPAKNIVSKAKKEMLPIIEGFWPNVSNNIEGKFDAIICMNVLAHVDNPKEFLIGCRKKISDDGLIFIQPSQARMFANNEFDTIYHEHISFFNTQSIKTLAKRSGLKLLDAFLVKIHGDSPVYVLQKDESKNRNYFNIRSQFAYGEFAINENLFEYEKNMGIYDPGIYKNFYNEAKITLNTLVQTVKKYKEDNYDIVFIGAAAKAMTVINSAGIDNPKFFDENPLKIGLYPPTSNLKIESLDKVSCLKNKTLFVLSAWNFRKELLNKIRDFGIPNDSVFFCYFPKPEFFK